MEDLIADGDPDDLLITLRAIKERMEDLDLNVSGIEDEIANLRKAIKDRDDLDNPPLCAHCNGSGEGQYDGTRCPVCRGTGTEKGE